MNSVEIGVLFNALNEILCNQDKIMKHCGVNKVDWDDVLESNSTLELAGECNAIACNHLKSV